MVVNNNKFPSHNKLYSLFGLVVLLCLITLGLGSGSSVNGKEKSNKRANTKNQSISIEAQQNSGVAKNVVYIEDNDPEGNKILAYRRNGDTGQIDPTPFGIFPTGGKGTGNPKQIIGPPDNDTPLIATPDGKFLLACNFDSNDISVFAVNSNGTLKAVEGSPFPSGGKNPVSLAFMTSKKTGKIVYVANKAQNPDLPAGSHPSREVPNYTGFRLSDTGQLTPIPNSTFKVAAGASPAQILFAGKKFVFAQDLYGVDTTTRVPAPLAPFLPQRVSLTHSFTLDKKTGTLKKAPNSPATPPNPDAPLPFLLGMIAHPTQPIIYQGLAARNELAVYSYDSKGSMKFEFTSSSRGAGLCWMVTTRDGKRLYASNTFDGTVSLFDLSNPLRPVETQVLFLSEPGPPNPTLFPPFASQPYQLTLDPTEKFLYIVNERSTSDPSVLEGNAIHVLRIDSNGTMTEPFPTVKPPVKKETGTLGIAIQGIVVF